MLTPQEMEENFKKLSTNLKYLQIKDKLEKLDNSIGNQMLSGSPPDLEVIENLKKKIYDDKTFEPIPVPPYQKTEQKTYFTNARNYLTNLFNSKDRHPSNVLEANHLCEKIFEKSMDLSDHHSGYDFNGLKTINRHFFQDYREDAGKIRAQDLEKNGTSCVPKYLIKTVGEKISSDLEMNNYLVGFNARDFSQQAGTYLAQLTRLHAFEHGNGRTNRMFISKLAELNNFSIAWQNISQKEMKETTIMAYRGDTSGFEDLLRSNLHEKSLEKVSNLMKDISNDLKIKRVDLDKSTHYEGTIIAAGNFAYLQQQKENPYEIIFHENVNFDAYPAYFARNDEPVFIKTVGNDWSLDYGNSLGGGSMRSSKHEKQSLAQEDYDQSKERDQAHFDHLYDEEYER